MTWTYNSKTGALWTPTGAIAGYGYSGTGMGRDNPDMQDRPMIGPTPRGRYTIGPSYKHSKLGPVVMNLDPIGHDALGRSLFRIHGDNARHDASNGCIILSRALREMIAKSEVKELVVV